MKSRSKPIRKVRREYLDSKTRTVKDSTLRYYEFVTRDFIEFLEARDVSETKEIDGYLIEQWKLKRQSEDDISAITLHNNTKHLRVFIRWLEASELVEGGLADKIQIPTVSSEQRRSRERVEPERMERILDYLSKYEYATRLHVSTALLWSVGCRASGLIALDKRDFKPAQKKIQFRNRKNAGTPLKNGSSSERDVTLSSSIMDLLTDYINSRRVEREDEYGRQPLFTKEGGRVSRQVLYKNFVAVSRPCVYTNDCPHGRKQHRCDAKQQKKRSFECPSSKSLHPIRRGSITFQLNQGFPKEELSDRCDVSPKVLEKHYDERTLEDKRQGRKEYVNLL